MPTALITGASRGLGYATAVHLARHGYDTWAGVRRIADGDDVRAVAAAEGLPLRPVELDVTDPSGVDAAVAEVLAGGPIDVVVNNAGIGTLGTIESTTDESLRQVLDVNLFGTLRVLRAVLPSMRERRAGTLVTMSSVNGLLALPVGGPYFISKHALEAATEMLAVEVSGFGLRVALVEPGAFATTILDDGVRSATPDADSPYAVVARRSAGMVDQGRQAAGDPMDVAAAVLHAVVTDEPKLRYLVGPDAVMLAAARRSVTDEDWVALGGIEDDADYFARMAALFGRSTAAA